MTSKMDPTLKAKLKKKFGGQTSRTGGKFSARRRTKKPRKSTNSDDKKLQTQLKKLNVNSIPAIEEVNLFKQGARVIHFQNPRVQASIAANTYVVSGKAEEKDLAELCPGILPQLGPGTLEDLKQMVSAENVEAAKKDNDDEIPDLVEATNFEDFSKTTDDKTEEKTKSDESKKDDDQADEPEKTEETEDKPVKLNPDEVEQVD